MSGAAPPPAARSTSLDQLCINTIRTLAMDAVQQADAGHPGTAMALAPLAYVLWQRHLRYHPAHPDWLGRDRFVLTAGHACILLYAVLYLTGYDLSLDDIERFRQWGSRTPGHSEHGLTPGVEATTGPLGQGVGNAVGMALAEAHLAQLFNRPGHAILDHCTYFLASDGDLMEGVSHEACSLAGHLKLGRLIGIYDDNRITIDGKTDLTYSDDVGKRFESYGWHVQRVTDGNDLGALDAALAAARRVTDRPSLVIVRTHIAFGSPHKQDTPEAHGAPLGEEEVRLTKQQLGWPSLEPFHVPDAGLAQWRRAEERGARLEAEWQTKYDAYRRAHPERAAELERRIAGRLPDGWDDGLPEFTPKEAQATRAASGKVLHALAAKLPELVGGSADLAASTNVVFKNGGDVAAGSWGARNVHFGIREHAMGAILNGLALHGGVRPVGSTFLIFSDYIRPPILLIASGSEVELVLGAYERLTAEGIAARAVSMPSMELFARQPREYRDAVIPPGVGARVAVEAASPQPWYRWVGDRGVVLGIERFGASAPYQRIYQEFGLTVDNVVAKAKELLVNPGAPPRGQPSPPRSPRG